MKLRRPAEEETTIEHEEVQEPAETTTKYEIQLAGYIDGNWKWDLYKNDHYIDSGHGSSRTDAFYKASVAATSHAERTTPIVRETIEYPVTLQGVLKQ